MNIEMTRWLSSNLWEPQKPSRLSKTAQLVLAFGDTQRLSEPHIFQEIRLIYPQAHIMSCSTAGEIFGAFVDDGSLVITAVEFEKSYIKTAKTSINDITESFSAGSMLAKQLIQPGLVHLFVLSDGLMVNGSELVKGLGTALPPNVAVTGGLAGDGARFQKTLVGLDEAPKSGDIAAIGFYGEHLKVGFGSFGGWDPFGVEWTVTASQGSTLYELDGKSALGLYKQYLGEHAKNLPASGLLFPLSLRVPGNNEPVVRTLLAVDEEKKALIFAGDIPQGAPARFMKANFDRLVEGASQAAQISHQALDSEPAELAILISCVGRKLVLKQRIEEEVEAVREILGEHILTTGFYSYGEISPFTPSARCELHNQTMTITTFKEC
jgi:hypothetical protein